MNLPGKKETKKNGPELDIDKDFFPELGEEIKQLPKEIKKPVEKPVEKTVIDQKSGPPRFTSTKKADIPPQPIIIATTQVSAVSIPITIARNTSPKNIEQKNVDQQKLDNSKFKFSAEKPRFVSSKGAEPKQKEVIKI